MTLQAPVLLHLISNMLEQPAIFSQHWTSIDSATIVFLTCKTLRQLGNLWHKSQSVHEFVRAEEQNPLQVYLARKRMRKCAHIVDSSVLLGAARIRARFFDRNAVVIALTGSACGVDNFVHSSKAWLRSACNKQFVLHAQRSEKQHNIRFTLKMKNKSLDVNGEVHIYVPRQLALLPQNAAEMSIEISPRAGDYIVDTIARWRETTSTNWIASAHGLVFIFEQGARGGLDFFEIFDEQSYARVHIGAEEQ